MPVIKELTINNPAYNLSSYTSEFIYVGDCTTVIWIVYSSSNGSLQLEWSIDQSTTIDSESAPLVALTSRSIKTSINAPYCRFSVSGLTNPCVLQTTGFFF